MNIHPRILDRFCQNIIDVHTEKGEDEVVAITERLTENEQVQIANRIKEVLHNVRSAAAST